MMRHENICVAARRRCWPSRRCGRRGADAAQRRAAQVRGRRRAAQLRLPRELVVRVHPSGAAALQHAAQVRHRRTIPRSRATSPNRGRSPRTGSTYTFKLRKGVKFHDGSTFTSEDIKATYDRLRKPPPGVLSIREATYADIAVDRDARSADGRLQAVEARTPRCSRTSRARGTASTAPRKLKQDPKFPERNIMGTGPVHVRRARRRLALARPRKFDDYFEKGKPLSRRLSRDLHRAARRW